MLSDPISAVLNLGGEILKRVIPDPEQRAKAEIELIKLKQDGELAKLSSYTEIAKGQMAINTIEAGHKNLFVSGWRPSIGWVCSAAFAFHFLVQPILLFIFSIFNIAIDLPAFDMSSLLTVLCGMIGIGGLRTVEKLKSKA